MITKAYIYNKVKALGALLTMPLLFASCVDTIILPDNLTVDEDFWKSKDDVSQMVNGAYRSMLTENVMSRLIVWGGLRGDEFVPVEAVTGALVEDLVEINLANTQEDNQFAEWGGIYSVINNCNIVLDRAEAVMAEDPSYTQGDYLADRSQMLALRALCSGLALRAGYAALALLALLAGVALVALVAFRTLRAGDAALALGAGLPLRAAEPLRAVVAAVALVALVALDGAVDPPELPGLVLGVGQHLPVLGIARQGAGHEVHGRRIASVNSHYSSSMQPSGIRAAIWST